MKITVVGCGKIGISIIQSLISENHDIVAIDEKESVVEKITNIYDVIGVTGNGVECETLEEAGAGKSDIFIAVTTSDELNMLSCFLAKKMGAKHTVARIRNPEYNDKNLNFMRQHLDIDVAINPERRTAKEISDILRFPTATKIESFSRGFEMIELKLKQDSPLDGVKLSELRAKDKGKFLICTVQRDEDVFIPDGNFVLKSGDKIGLTATQTEIARLLKAIGLSQKQAKSTMILGGNRTAFYLAKTLLSSGVNVKIIDSDKNVCAELCEALPEAVIINGDGGHQELLFEEGIKDTDAFVSLTGMDEENILISIFANTQNVPKVITKINSDERSLLAEKLGLETIISPQEIVADIVLRYARALQNSEGSNVETLYKLMDGKAEALEFNVHQGSSVTNIPLRELKLKQNLLIAGILRDRKTIIPNGDDVIMPSDRVVVITKQSGLHDLSDIVR